MGLRNALSFGSSGNDGPGTPNSIEVGQDLVDDLRERVEAAGPVVHLTPYKRDRNHDTSRSFFRGVHRVRRGGPKRRENVSSPFTFEIHYDGSEGTIGFRYVADEDVLRSEIRQEIESCYHDSDVTRSPPTFVDVDEGDYASAAWLTLRHPEPLRPVNNPGLNPSDFHPDPYDSITSRMVGDGSRSASVVTQLVFKPAISHADQDSLNWHDGVDEVAKRMKEPNEGFRWQSILTVVANTFVEKDLDVKATQEGYLSSEDKEAANVIANQRNRKGFHVIIRVVAIADEPELAERRVASTCEKYRNYYNSTHGQGFKPVFDVDVGEVLSNAARRKWIDREMPMSLDEAVALGAPPTDLNTPAVEYTHQRSDEGVPASVDGFEKYDETGYTDRQGNP
ncbi:hypothetical protein OB920_05240 [Halobacteria archaeon HArc-gm2]|nr:hypothetical protein [Halobacteria archaeon HArc-gm2]